MGILDNNKTDPNKILPIHYPWAREYYKMGVANNWVPEEIPMMDDLEQWKSDTLTKDERRLILWNLGFFSTAESLTANNIVLAVYNHITDPAVRQYLLRQAFEEAIHTDTFIYCCDTFGFNPDEIYVMYETIPSIKAKDSFVVDLTKVIFDPAFKPDTTENRQKLLQDLIGFYVIMEGIFFYAGFAMMLALKRQKKMTGVGQQFEFIMRDESVHLAFGCALIEAIKAEYPETWTPAFQKNTVKLIKQAVELEREYAFDACPHGLLGINAHQFAEYVEYVADRRLQRLGLDKVYDTRNPLPWMSEATDLAKEKNFFETKVNEYRNDLKFRSPDVKFSKQE